MTEPPRFLARWSERKRAANHDGAQKPVQPAPESIPEEEEAFDLASLPAIEDLAGDSDLSAFMHKAVPETLRNAALRRVWALDPFLKDFTGPVDYGWDFNKPETIPGFSGEAVAFDAQALADKMLSPLRADSPSIAEKMPDLPESPEETDLASCANTQERDGASEGHLIDKKHENEEKTVSLPSRRRHGGALPT